MIHPLHITGPLFTETKFKDVKDPCIVCSGDMWHIYGSGGSVQSESWHILHATAPSIEGPWKEVDTVEMIGVKGDEVAAPSVVYDDTTHIFHMVVQTNFLSIGGKVEYLTSHDGHVFTKVETVLDSLPGTSEAGIYDPHQSIINGKKYLVYAGTPEVYREGGGYSIQPDVHIAESEHDEKSWNGPWKRLGVIVDHDHIDWHHNKRGTAEYEWGIEGPQIVPLPNGTYLLNATCFLQEGRFGERQRVFFAIADGPSGPYTSLGPVIKPGNYPDQEWMSGENGHASVLVHNNTLYLFFQGRSKTNQIASENNWRYGIATFSLEDLNRQSNA